MKQVIVDPRIEDVERNAILSLNLDILECPICSDLYDAVCGHPDMLMHIIDSKNIVVHSNIHQDFIDKLEGLGLNVHLSKNPLKNSYPEDIALNALNLEGYFIHNLPYTDETLMRLLIEKKLVQVKQGYTKCSTAIISPRAVITSDKGIAKALNNCTFDVLLVPPGDILLPGLNYGFIGGCCGLIEENLLAFYGSLECYSYGYDVMQFLKKHKVEPIYLRQGKLIDRGSIFTILSE